MLIYVYQMICIVVVFVVGITLFFRHRKFVIKKNEFLKSEQQLVEAHYDTVKWQTEQIKNYQQSIQEQMQMIEKFKTEEISNEKVSEYLRGLKQEYHSLESGLYCNEWIVDAVLVQQRKICEDKGIELAAFMQNYDRGMIQEQTLVQLFIQLFEQAISETIKVTKKENKKIFFQCTKVGNQLIIELNYGCLGSNLHINIKLRQYLMELKGEIKVNQKSGTGNIVVMLQC